MRKTYTAKTPLGDFKVTTLENPLLSKQLVISKGIPVPYTNLQLNLYPNTQLDLFCSDNLSFSMHGSQYVTSITNQRRLLAAKFFSSSYNEDQEVVWSQNPMVYKHSSFFKGMKNQGKLDFRLHFSSHLCNCALVQLV